jgi:hypothetical protein
MIFKMRPSGENYPSFLGKPWSCCRKRGRNGDRPKDFDLEKAEGIAAKKEAAVNHVVYRALKVTAE